MKKVSKEELAKIVERHGRWLRGEDGGERANLSNANLLDAVLVGADLTGARLDGTKREEKNV